MTASAAGRRLRASLVLLYYLASAALLAASPAEAAAQHSVAIHYPVAVVLYDPQGRLEDLNGVHVAYRVSTSIEGWRIVYVFNVSFVEAPAWAVERLAEWLRGNAAAAPMPAWARGCPGAAGNDSTVERVELKSYYGFLYRLTSEVAKRAGLEPRWSVAVVAVPGVRLLYASEPYPWVPGLELGFEGARLYTGWRRLTLYDLYALQARHPSYPVPFSGMAPPVDCFTEPILPAMKSPGGHVVAVVKGLLSHQVANLLGDRGPWYADRLTVDIYVVDYGGNLTGLLWSLDTGEVARLLRLLDPWVEPLVRLHVVPGSRAPWGALNTTRDGEGNTVVDLDENPALVGYLRSLSRRLGCSGVARECRFAFYWLLLPGRAYMTLGWGLNFTGIDLGAAAVAAYPGYHGRVLRGGAARTVAHEAGHGMGLPHPFQRGMDIDWRLDYAYTVMSYCDAITAAAPPNATMRLDADKLALLHSLALLGGSGEAGRKALGLIEKGRVEDALRLLLRRGEGSREAAAPTVAAPPPGATRVLLALALVLLLALLVSIAACCPRWQGGIEAGNCVWRVKPCR